MAGWHRRYSGDLAWAHFFNKASFLHEMEETLLPLRVMTALKKGACLRRGEITPRQCARECGGGRRGPRDQPRRIATRAVAAAGADPCAVA